MPTCPTHPCTLTPNPTKAAPYTWQFDNQDEREYLSKNRHYHSRSRIAPAISGLKSAGAAEQWLENLATVRGLDALATRGLRLDLLVGYEAFEGVGRLAAAYPELGIMLNHCGNPPIREEGFAAWSAALAPLVHYPNILVKYSSPLLYTYPDAHADRVRPYTDFLLEQFGPERLAWGSNWPVELLGGSYRESFELMQLLANELSQAARAAVFGGNAQTFYGSGGQLFQQDQGAG